MKSQTAEVNPDALQVQLRPAGGCGKRKSQIAHSAMKVCLQKDRKKFIKLQQIVMIMKNVNSMNANLFKT